MASTLSVATTFTAPRDAVRTKDAVTVTFALPSASKVKTFPTADTPVTSTETLTADPTSTVEEKGTSEKVEAPKNI